MTNGSKDRNNPTIDSLKGLLICLVVIGHSFTVSPSENALRWAIYSFHMPVFIGLAGFLLNHSDLRSGTLSGIWEKYGVKVVVPWLIMFVAYNIIIHAGDRLSPDLIASSILRPAYHTWYVPVFLSFIVISYFISQVALFSAMIIAIVVGTAAMIAFGWGNYSGIWPGKLVIDRHYFTVAPYFFFGLWLRQSGNAGLGNWGLGLALIAGAAFEACFFWHVGAMQFIPNLLLNIGLISTFPRLFAVKLRIPLIHLIGWNSLYFYLWHPLIIEISKRTLYKRLPETLAAAVTVALTFIVMFVGLALIERSSILRLMSGVQAPRKNRPDALRNGRELPLVG